MWQVLFRIPYFNIPVHGYGVMLVLSFFAAMELAKFLARHSRIDPEIFANAALIALITGVLGARLSHVLENWSQFTTIDATHTAWSNFKEAINIPSGGLTYYGGFILAFPSVLAYGVYRRVPLRLGMDIVAPCLMVGLGIGRIGCYLNGCCYGAESNVPWASHFPYYSNAYIEEFENNRLQQPVPRDLLVPGTPLTRYLDLTHQEQLQEPVPNALLPDLLASYLKRDSDVGRLAVGHYSNAVHPAELYSAFTGMLLAAFLAAYFTLPHAPGRVFALMLIVEGISRYLLEILRVEPPRLTVAGYGLSLSMILAVILIALGAVLWIGFGVHARSAAAAPPKLRAASAPT